MCSHLLPLHQHVTCQKGIDMVSGDRICIDDVGFTIDDSSSISHCNDLSLDLHNSSTSNVLHASVDGPCVSCSSCLTKSHDDMLSMSCCHNINASNSSSTCMANNVEKSQHLLEQDVDFNGASNNTPSSSFGSHVCLMATNQRNPHPWNPLHRAMMKRRKMKRIIMMMMTY